MTRYREQVAVRLPDYNYIAPTVQIVRKKTTVEWLAVFVWCFAIPAIFIAEVSGMYGMYRSYDAYAHSQPRHTVCR